MNQRHGFWNMAINLGPILVGFTISGVEMLGSSYPVQILLLAVSFVLGGLFLFLRAKISVIVSGHPISFGPRLMTPQNQLSYKMGYALMGISAVLVLGLLPGSHG